MQLIFLSTGLNFEKLMIRTYNDPTDKRGSKIVTILNALTLESQYSAKNDTLNVSSYINHNLVSFLTP